MAEIAITGATGFIGRQLLRALERDGHIIRVLCRPTSASLGSSSGRVRVVVGDIRDQQSLEPLLAGVETVFHLAAGTKMKEWAPYYESSVVGTRNLIEAARKFKVARFVYASSAGIYRIAGRPNGYVVDENSALDNPAKRTFYARAKILAEQAVQDAVKQGGISIVILRPSLVYGPENAFCSVLFPLIKGRLRVGLGSPERKVALVHIDDLVQAFLLAATKGRHGSIYNIVDDQSPAYGDYLKVYQELREPKTPVIYVPYRMLAPLARLKDVFRPAQPEAGGVELSHRIQSFCSEVRFSSTRAQQELGWSPQVKFEEGMRRALEVDGKRKAQPSQQGRRARFGLIGCGQVAREFHLAVMKAIPEMELVALCDVDAERLRAASQQSGVRRMYDTIEGFLDDAGDLDAVVVATPGFTHYDIGMSVLDKGLHLLLEKPAALQVEHARDLLRKARSSGLRIAVGHTYRFRDPVITTMAALERGALGEVYQVHMVHRAGELFLPRKPRWNWMEIKNKVLLYEYSLHFLDLGVLFAGDVTRLVGARVVRDEQRGTTKWVNVITEHASGATGIVDLQLFASAHSSYVDVWGTQKRAHLDFYPHHYREDNGFISPLHDFRHSFLRMADFGIETLAGKLNPKVPRRAVPHYRLLKAFLNAWQTGSDDYPVDLEKVMPTMEFLELLGSAVYGEVDDALADDAANALTPHPTMG